MLLEFPGLLEKGIAVRKKAMHDVIEAHLGCKKEPKLHFIVEKGQRAKILMKINRGS